MRRAHHDRRRAPVIKTVASSNDDLLVEPARRPGEAEARAEIVIVSVDPVGQDSGLLGYRTQHGGLRQALVVVT